ncbi:MAG TPA: TRAP transporter large permease subunit, partial [Aliiroseovarius sp.]|nr:TRAP transporter large permease subunit [Aliiroseovarius sp.]
IAALAVMTYALQNYAMNVKAIHTAEDRMGITIGAIGALMLLAALVWSGWRVFRIENTLHGVLLETAKTTSLVFIILLGAAMLTASFRAFGGEDLVRNFLNSMPGGFWSQFFIVMLVIFVLGFFLDFIEISVVVVPIVAPILLSDPGANITAVWLGVMIGLNIQTSFLTPPFGFALFYLRGVAPAVVKTVQMYRGVIAFILLQLIALGIVGSYPPLVNYLPKRVSFLSENAPPPRNPKMQLCLEAYTGEQLAADAATRNAVEAAQRLDLSALPDDLADDLRDGFASGGKALALLDEAFAAQDAVEAAAPGYRPLLAEVRGLEKQIRRLDDEAATLRKRLSQTKGEDEEATAQRASLEVRIAGLDAEISALKAQLPPEWEDAHASFAALNKAEATARNKYRRAADDAWEGPATFLATLDGNAAFEALQGELNGLKTQIESADPAEAMAAIKALEGKFGDIEGARDVKSPLGKARRAMKGNEPDREKAMAQYEKARAAYEAQLAWRRAAEGQVRQGVEAYLDGIRPTIGIRNQARFTREQALWMAGCEAHHRDVSLNF